MSGEQRRGPQAAFMDREGSRAMEDLKELLVKWEEGGERARDPEGRRCLWRKWARAQGLQGPRRPLLPPPPLH